MKVVAIVLAAGAGSRFGSAKQLALLGGRPLLQHPLDALAAAGVGDVVVVLGDDADVIERAIAWRKERRRVNERPQDGLSSSLRIGLDAAAEDPAADAVLVVLGDQPSLRPDVVRAVEDAATATDRPIVRARYAADDAPNPVLVRRSAWALAAGLDGDRGLGPLLAQRPDLVEEVPVRGAIPDIDTAQDLATLQAVLEGPAVAHDERAAVSDRRAAAGDEWARAMDGRPAPHDDRAAATDGRAAAASTAAPTRDGGRR